MVAKEIAQQEANIHLMPQGEIHRVGNMGELVHGAGYTPTGVLRITRNELLGLNGQISPERKAVVEAVPGQLADHIIANELDALLITPWGLAKAEKGEEVTIIDLPKTIKPAQKSENG